jgi:hypothetical protein
LQFKSAATPALVTASSAAIPSAAILGATAPCAPAAPPRAFTAPSASTPSAPAAPRAATPYANPPAKSPSGLHGAETFKKLIESIFEKYNP